MKNKKQLRIDKAYMTVSNKNPEVTDPIILEHLTRNYLRRQKLIKVSLLLLLAIAVALAGARLENASQPPSASLSLLFKIAGPIMVVVSIYQFSRIFQDPLTPNEAKELEAGNTAEKNEPTDENLPKKKHRRHISYEQEKYNNASGFGKLLILLKRIPLSVYLIILALSVFGTIHMAKGIQNITTFEERNENAVEVTATIHRIELYYDRNHRRYHNVYWKYTYNGSYYTYKGSTYSSGMAEGDTDTLLIDSVHPEIVIVNDGNSNLLHGSVMLGFALFILVFSLKKVRKIENDFTFFSLMWLIPAFFTVFIATQLITMIRDGYPLLMILIFAILTPILLFITRFFYKILNRDSEKRKQLA